MKRVAIIGSGDLGQQILHIIKSISSLEPIGFFDDYEKKGSYKSEMPILGDIKEVALSFKRNVFDELIIGVGYKHLEFRAELFDRYFGDIPFARVVHSSCFIDPSVKVGEGCVIYPGCIVDQGSEIEHNVLLNVGCTIAHHTRIQSHCFLSPRVALAGFINIGPKVNLGINTTVIDNISICSGVRTGGGAVVVKNIEKPGLYLGVPAKLIKS